MRAGASPGFRVSPQQTHAGLGMPTSWPDQAWPRPEPDLPEMALEEYSQQLCPNHKHVELKDKGTKEKRRSLCERREPLAEPKAKPRVAFDNRHFH